MKCYAKAGVSIENDKMEVTVLLYFAVSQHSASCFGFKVLTLELLKQF